MPMGAPKVKAKPILPALRLSPGEVPYTIRRLQSHRPGESFRFYVGALADLDSEETPAMSALLHRIFAAARGLEERGQIAITKTKIAGKGDDPTNRAASYEFTAIGVVAA
jgi:hypothetical protein